MYKDLMFEYLNSYTDMKELVLKTMEGIQVSELSRTKKDIENSLVDLVSEEGEFLADPIPNLYFTRDPFASIGDGISLNKMYSATRNRETIYAEYIFNYHPKYMDKVTKYYDRTNPFSIEGGDILNLNEHVLAVGISQRTSAEAIDMLQAMNTGHDGSLSTGHGNSPVDMLSRIETMVLMGVDMPLSAIKGQIAAGIDIIVHLGRMRDRTRKILEICEVE